MSVGTILRQNAVSGEPFQHLRSVPSSRRIDPVAPTWYESSSDTTADQDRYWKNLDPRAAASGHTTADADHSSWIPTHVPAEPPSLRGPCPAREPLSGRCARCPSHRGITCRRCSPTDWPCWAGGLIHLIELHRIGLCRSHYGETRSLFVDTTHILPQSSAAPLPGRFTSWGECDLVRRRMIPACPGSGRGPSPGPGLSRDACPGSFHMSAGCDLVRVRMISAHRGSAAARPGAQHRRSAAPGRSTSHPRRQPRGRARHRRPRQPRQPER